MTRVGIIGFGGFGRFLARAWSEVEGVAVKAIADVNPVAAGAEYEYFSDWRALLDSGKVDVVSVVTPPVTHADIAVAALERGIHVLVEKPIAVSVEDARRLVEAEQQSSATASVDFMLRYNPIIVCVHEWCREGVFGPLQRVVVENYAQDESLTPGHWFWDPRQSGGILVEHAVHFIDIVNGCTDAAVASVQGRGWQRPDGRVDRVSLEVCYEDGLVASQYHAFNRLNPFERTSLRFVFAGAQIDVEGWIPMNGRVVALVGPAHDGVLDTLPGLSVTAQMDVDATRNVPVAGLDGQHRVDRIMEATFGIPSTKEEAYQDALKKLMSDLLQATEGNPKPTRVTLADGLRAIEIAAQANSPKV